MRKRNIAVAAVLGVTGALALSGVAQAAPASPHGYTLTVSPTKQESKTRGGVNVTGAIDERFEGGTLAGDPAGTCPAVPSSCTFFPPAVRSQFFLANEFRFNTGKLSNTPCQLSQVSTANATTARANCASSLVGTGSAVIRTLSGGFIFAAVSAFVSGNTQVFIHIDVPVQVNKPVLTGNLVPPATLDVILQPVTGTVIDDISVTFPKKKTSTKKQNKAGNPKFFIAAKCTDGTWSSTQLTTFQGGSTSAGTPSNTQCKKKK